ncbi:DUF3226 domain-containing protein [Spirosoma luteum]|uniref:DUF3226 domain-containing protein n=1 Tax=Spirosoma luteum TaxID=431553 RepID=UPI00036EC418|nr:DUF3226 domain-containing protein [Spirosoma luteum]
MSENISRRKFSFKLLVEGKDDLYVTATIRDAHQLPDNFEIVDCEGIDKMPDQIVARIKLQRPKINTIGIVLDADKDLKARWDSIRDTLRKENYEVPELPEKDGTVIAGIDRNPTVGIWLMPDNLQLGMLEDFVQYLIPESDLLRPYVGEVLRKIEGLNIDSLYNPQSHRAKAFIHTWLAWQKDPGTPMGLALTKTYLDHNAELCLRFVSWLNRLFNPY